MRIRVAYFGKDKSGLFEPAAAEYAARLKHSVSFEWKQLEASTKKGTLAAADEWQRILALKTPRDYLVVLAERGTQLDSKGWAGQVGRVAAQGKDLLFAIGGDEGWPPGVESQCDWCASLGLITMPHRLARVVLVEQLYRAYTIQSGHPYHK